MGTRVLAAPTGDLTDENMRPVEAFYYAVEMWEGPSAGTYPAAAVLLVVDGDHLDALARGGRLVLGFVGAQVPVFHTGVAMPDGSLLWGHNDTPDERSL